MLATDEANTEAAIQAAGKTAPRIKPEDIGEDIAFRQAREMVCAFEGYTLRNKLSGRV